MATRLCPDPAVGIAEIQQCFAKLFQEEGSFDLVKLLEPPAGSKVSWKSTPDVAWLGSKHMSRLMGRLFQLHQNGVMSSKKMKMALTKYGQAQRINFSTSSDLDFLDAQDERVRIAAAQLRTLHKDPACFQRSMKKASAEEKKNVESALGFLMKECGGSGSMPPAVPESKSLKVLFF